MPFVFLRPQLKHDMRDPNTRAPAPGESRARPLRVRRSRPNVRGRMRRSAGNASPPAASPFAGRPTPQTPSAVRSFPSIPRPGLGRGTVSLPDSMSSAGSPIISAASAAASISGRSGLQLHHSGSDPVAPRQNDARQRHRCARTRVRRQRANFRRAGRLATSKILRTAPRQAIPTPALAQSRPISSKEGMMPISAAPAHQVGASAGTRNIRSKRPCCSPCSMPQTSGTVFR